MSTPDLKRGGVYRLGTRRAICPRRTSTTAGLVAMASLFICASLGADVARADYSVPPAYDMLGASDLVVVGKISRLQTKTFDLRVSKVIAGKTAKRSIRVKRFRNWTCASRWTSYKVGQQVVLLLSRKTSKSPWLIRSGGGEGEIPVVGKYVYLRGLNLRGLKTKKHLLGSARKAVYGQRMTLARFVKLVRGYRKCYRFRVDHNQWFAVRGIRRVCSQAVLKAFSRRGKLEQALVKATPLFNIP